MPDFWTEPLYTDKFGPFGQKRKPERMELVLTALKFYWQQNDQQRLGQIMYNIMRDEDGQFQSDLLFNIEDDQMFERILSYVK